MDREVVCDRSGRAGRKRGRCRLNDGSGKVMMIFGDESGEKKLYFY